MIRFFCICLGLLAAGGATAQAPFPGRQVSMVVGFAPGGGTDTASRIIAKKLAENLGQSVVVENKPGAGGNIATDLVAKSAPDGATILLASVGSLTVTPHLVAKLPYDPIKDFAPITLAVVFPNLLVVHPSLGVNTLAEHQAIAQSSPARSPSARIGGAGPSMSCRDSQVDIAHVPRRRPAVPDLLGGRSGGVATPRRRLPVSGRSAAWRSPGARASVPTYRIAESAIGLRATNWRA
jgi:tripartite-type tricarboxylate transporter receptor subunit TctC